ncbi:MAG TPA: MFS transporter [Terracidiphilus sp.]|nr:MFS transporter [Terracidiphilus sp.]
MSDSHTGAVATRPATQRGWQFAVSSGILGWVLDAYYFFILIFLVDALARNFHVTKAAVVWSITVTLATRPLGALLLGYLADRYGRRRPLMACVLFFSLVSALTPFAPNYAVFLLLRALYGVGMGGYWGIGASLVMESSPARWRGLFSGIMQSGYSVGYLLAALAVPLVAPRWGWPCVFLAGLAIAAVVAWLTLLAPESQAWQRTQLGRAGDLGRVVMRHKWEFVYLVLLMTVITCLSHGTQDLYPDFLTTLHGFSSAMVSRLAIFYNVGAILGALVVGHLSEKLGRRRSILLALAITLAAMPAWAFGASVFALAGGSFVMQFGVQGVFGVIPAHLNELSPASVRSLFPGVVYQLGMLLGAPSVGIEYALRRELGYAWALSAFELCTIAVLFLLCTFGPERRGRDLAS